MADAETSKEGPSLQTPRAASALRSSRPKPKRVHTRVAIAVPENSTATDDVSGSQSSSTSKASPSTRSPDTSITSTPWAKSLILTLDGGGIRGYSSLIILRALMNAIALAEQTFKPTALSSAYTPRIDSESIPDHVLKNGQYLPCHYFDYIAGTSVGGLIAIMLGMLGKGVDECIAEFQRQNKSIPLPDDLPPVGVEFPLLHRRTTWPTKRTRAFFDTFAKFTVTSTAQSLASSTAQHVAASSAIREAVDGDSTTTTESREFRKDLLQCQTLAWCTEVEEEHRKRRPYAFCSYREEEDDPQKMISIPEVAKAITTPWSSYFKPFKLGSGLFVDGSKQIRDPTLEMMKEIKDLLSGSGEPPIDILLSIGTDEHHAWFYEKLKMRPANSVSSPSQADITKEKDTTYLHYHRFEVTDIHLGLRKKFYLREIEEATLKWLKTDHQKEKIRHYAEMLVERRRARANTARWETFALGVRYRCFHEKCQGVDRLFDTRGDFFDHLDRQHKLLQEAARNKLDKEVELDKGRRFGCV